MSGNLYSSSAEYSEASDWGAPLERAWLFNCRAAALAESLQDEAIEAIAARVAMRNGCWGGS